MHHRIKKWWMQHADMTWITIRLLNMRRAWLREVKTILHWSLMNRGSWVKWLTGSWWNHNNWNLFTDLLVTVIKHPQTTNSLTVWWRLQTSTVHAHMLKQTDTVVHPHFHIPVPVTCEWQPEPVRGSVRRIHWGGWGGTQSPTRLINPLMQLQENLWETSDSVDGEEPGHWSKFTLGMERRGGGVSHRFTTT